MDLPMDLSLILSMIAITLSSITLWLTEIRGPDISLLNAPKFEVSDEMLNEQQIQKYTPRWFKLNPVPLVFANNGGKTGTILELSLVFVPLSSFKRFLDRFYAGTVTLEGDLSPPFTINEGDNECLNVSPEIRTIDWKETSVAEVLDPSLKIDDIAARAWERSKEKFKSFCDFLDKSQELGKVSCTITLTKGRFRTKVTKEKVFENFPVANKYDKAVLSLRGCLRKWENLEPTKAELLNLLIRDFEGLINELKANLSVLEGPLDVYDISHKAQACKLRVDIWNQLQRIRDIHERKIRWFLIKSEEELEQELTKLYERITNYNRSIDELIFLDRLGSHESARFRRVNAEKEKLHSEVEQMCDRLSRSNRRYIS